MGAAEPGKLGLKRPGPDGAVLDGLLAGCELLAGGELLDGLVADTVREQSGQEATTLVDGLLHSAIHMRTGQLAAERDAAGVASRPATAIGAPALEGEAPSGQA